MLISFWCSIYCEDLLAILCDVIPSQQFTFMNQSITSCCVFGFDINMLFRDGLLIPGLVFNHPLHSQCVVFLFTKCFWISYWLEKHDDMINWKRSNFFLSYWECASSVMCSLLRFSEVELTYNWHNLQCQRWE